MITFANPIFTTKWMLFLVVAQPGGLPPSPRQEKKDKKREKDNKKLIIFMQQMQYNASNRMNVFQKFSGVTPSNLFLVLLPLPSKILAARLVFYVVYTLLHYRQIVSCYSWGLLGRNDVWRALGDHGTHCRIVWLQFDSVTIDLVVQRVWCSLVVQRVWCSLTV